MKKTLWVVGLVLVLAVVAVGLLQHFRPETLQRFSMFAGAPAAPEIKVEDFELLDHKGRWHDLHRQSGSKAIVLISTANGCPAVKEAVRPSPSVRHRPFRPRSLVPKSLESMGLPARVAHNSLIA